MNLRSAFAAIFAMICAGASAQAEPRAKPTSWLLDLGYVYGWECGQPYWGWFQFDANKIAVVSATSRDHASQNGDVLGPCVEFGVRQFLTERASGRASGNTLSYTLYGPDGAVWFERVFDFSG